MPYSYYAVADVFVGDEHWYRAFGFAGEACVWRSFWRKDRESAEKAGAEWLLWVARRNPAVDSSTLVSQS